MQPVPEKPTLTQKHQGKVMVVCGALSAFSFAPYYYFPLILIFLSLLFSFVRKAASTGTAFKLGYWFGFGLFLTGTYWISNSLFVEIEKHWWLIPFALIAIPLIAGLYTGAACALSHKFRKLFFVYWLVFAFFWVIFEYVRTWWPFTFPWNLVGYTVMASDEIVQIASIVGVYGLSFLVLLLSGAIACFTQGRQFSYKLPAILMGLLFFFMGKYGADRLEQNPTEYTQTYIRIVQANIDQKTKWDKKYFSVNFHKYLALTSEPADKSIDIVIWPEMATPFNLQTDHIARNLIKEALPSKGAYSLVGSARYESDEQGNLAEFWNSLFALDQNAEVKEVYDKNILVPFGEFIPFRGFWPVDKLEAVAMGAHSKDFSSGTGIKTLRLNGLPDVSPLICYEGIFSGHVARHEPDHKPAWLLNLTNDAWFGDSAGPRQHADMVRVRAIEEGMPMVRVAGTGISFVCDSYGRIITSIPLNTAGIRDIYLPQALKEDTVYRQIIAKVKNVMGTQ